MWIHPGFETQSRRQIKGTCGPTNDTDIVLDKINFGYIWGSHFDEGMVSPEMFI